MKRQLHPPNREFGVGAHLSFHPIAGQRSRFVRLFDQDDALRLAPARSHSQLANPIGLKVGAQFAQVQLGLQQLPLATQLLPTIRPTPKCR